MFRGNFLSPFLSVVCLLAFVPAGQAQVSADRLVAIMGFQVDLGLGGDVDSAWESLQGGELGIAVASATTGRDRVQAAAGYTYVGELALSGAVTSGRLAMTDWLNSVIRGLEWKRTVTTTEVLRDGSPGMSRSYFDAFPVRYVFPELSASGTGNLTETLVVKPMRVEMAGGSRGAAQSANEVLENGAGRFGVDLDGLPDASSRIRGVAVDDLTIDTREMTRGTARGFRAYGPGTVNTGNLTLTFARGRNNEVYQWWLDTSQGRSTLKTVTVSLLNRGGSVARSYTFFDCVPVSYKSGNVSPGSSNATEELVVKIGRIEFN